MNFNIMKKACISTLSLYSARINYLEYQSVESNTRKETIIKNMHKWRALTDAGVGVLAAVLILPKPKNPFMRTCFSRFGVLCLIGSTTCIFYGPMKNIFNCGKLIFCK